jgi:hypothetical protein
MRMNFKHYGVAPEAAIDRVEPDHALRVKPMVATMTVKPTRSAIVSVSPTFTLDRL